MKHRLRPSLVARTVPTGHLHETLTLARIKSGLQRLGLSLGLLIATVSGARAQFTDWNAATGDWSNPANWTSDVPNASLSAIIGFGSSGTATISSSDTNETALGLFIGQRNTAALTINLAETGSIGRSVTVASGGILTRGIPSLPEANQPGVVDLLISKSGLTDQFWDGPLTKPNGVSGGNGGLGTWNNTTTNWTNFNGTVNAPWQSGFAIFAGSGGIVTLGDDINFIGIQFAINGYFITAGGTAFALTATQTSANGGTIITVDPASLAIIDAPITGPGQIVKNGSGILILTGANNYSGGTAINEGTLQLGNGGSTGSIVGSVVDNATLAIDHSNSITLAGDISGNGGLEQIGTGSTILSGNNTYSGVTLVTRGVLVAGSSTAFSPYSQLSVSAGAFVSLGSFSETIGSLTGAGTVTADGGILIVGNEDSTTTFSGHLRNGAGTLRLVKIGSGTLTLTGTNDYTGGTIINRGTLQIGNGGTTGSIIGNVTDNGALAFNRGDAVTFDGTISGRGSVLQSGTGEVTLSAANSYSGGTTVNAGSLIVDSAQALGTGDVTVNGGILTADPQPINVHGNYLQGPSGTLLLLVAGPNPGQYDYLNVTGNAVLGGTLQLINQGFVPKAGETLNLVRAGGTITSQFSRFINPFTTGAGLNTIDLVYSLHSVDLEFLNIVPPSAPLSSGKITTITTINFASFAQTPNELAAGELLDAEVLNPRFGNLLNFFLAQPFADLPGELAIIGPQSFTSFYEISFSDANIQRLSLENRLDDIRASWGSLNEAPTEGGTVGLQKSSGFTKDGKNPVEPVLQPVRQPVFDLWASGFGDFVHVDSDYNARGYRFTTSGFDLGFDYRFLDHFAVGVMGNYTYTWTDLRPGTITVNSGRGGVYAGYFTSGYYLNAGVYGGYNTYDSSRHGLDGIATGNTDGQEWSGFVSTGYDFRHGDLTVGPIASLQYTNVHVNSFTETGSLLPLNIHSDSEESLRSDIGLRAYYQWHVGSVIVTPNLKATWEHEFKYSALPITAGLAEFPGPDETFVGAVEGQDSAVISVGLSVQWTPMISTYAAYDGQLGRGRYNSNAVTGGVRVSW